jgi:hypothetical protein
LKLHRLGYDVHTHLKGRIFNTDGVSYLVLHHEADSAERLTVKSLCPRPEVKQMPVEEIRQHLAAAAFSAAK